MLVAALLACALPGAGFYLVQLRDGLGVTGLSRDVSWGLYIGQFTFFVGVAASAVTVVLPYYLHDYKAFARVTILGEFLAVSAVVMCVLFIFVDMGQPSRILNVLIHPSLSSLMFWDTVVLLGYLILNLVIGWTTLESERMSAAPPAWVKPLIYLSIPWAVSIHTVTAFLYAGLPGRPLWLTSLMAARFLASAFSSGGAILLITCLVVKRISSFDPGAEPVRALARIVVYFLVTHLFLTGLELFTAYYSAIPSHSRPIDLLLLGRAGNSVFPGMAVSLVLAGLAVPALVTALFSKNEFVLMISSAAAFIAIGIEKGLVLVYGGFIPSPLERVTGYSPTLPEMCITISVWCVGLLILSFLVKMTLHVREQETG